MLSSPGRFVPAELHVYRIWRIIIKGAEVSHDTNVESVLPPTTICGLYNTCRLVHLSHLGLRVMLNHTTKEVTRPQACVSWVPSASLDRLLCMPTERANMLQWI
jgi:hypothetical protein